MQLLVAARAAQYTYRQSTSYDTTSAAFKERRAQAAKWETAVMGKMFYEPGSRERFDAAIAKDDEEAGRAAAEAAAAARSSDGRSSDSSDGARPPSEPYHMNMSVEEVTQQPIPVVKRHIVNLLSRAENRLLNAPDYGSYMMMGQMHQGEAFLQDAEVLLQHFGLMTKSIEASIEDVRDKAREIQCQLDLRDY